MKTSAVLLRDARRDEVPAIVAMLADDDLGAARDKVVDPLPPAYYAAYDRIAASGNNRLLIAELDGEVVGTLQLAFIPGMSKVGAEKMLVEAVRVTRARRGTGIGRQIMAAVIDIARARRCKSVELSSHRNRLDAHRFYKGLGFVASHVGMKLGLD